MSRLSNIEKISETICRSNYYQMQHFISDSNWNAFAVIDKISEISSKVLPMHKLKGLHIDESGWAKKGRKSVGVAKQYCGNLGKVENCQVAVFGCLNVGDYSSLIDTRLYLPKSWIKDKTRCDQAQVPYGHRVFRTKQELALDIIFHQLDQGVDFDYIGSDALYGSDEKFVNTLDDNALTFMLDIKSDQQIYTKKSEILYRGLLHHGE